MCQLPQFNLDKVCSLGVRCGEVQVPNRSPAYKDINVDK